MLALTISVTVSVAYVLVFHVGSLMSLGKHEPQILGVMTVPVSLAVVYLVYLLLMRLLFRKTGLEAADIR